MEKQPKDHETQKNRSNTRHKWLRRVGIGALGVLVLLLICVFAVLLLLANLDNPRIARWLKHQLKEDLGLQVDFESLSLSPFSGLLATDVRILNPQPFNTQAETFLSVDKIQADWDFWPLVIGRLRMGALRIENVDLHIVEDKQAGSSLSKLTAGLAATDESSSEDSAEEDPMPISHLMEPDRFALTLEHFSLRNLRLEYIVTDAGVLLAKHRLGALNAEAAIKPGPQSNDLHFSLTPGDSGLSLVSREQKGNKIWQKREAVFDVKLALTTPKAKTLSVDVVLDLVRQNAWSVIIPRRLLHVLAQVQFMPQEGKTSITLDKLDALSQVINTTLAADLIEQADGTKLLGVQNIQVLVDASQLKQLLPTSWGLDFGSTTGRLVGDNLHFRLPGGASASSAESTQSSISPKGGGKMKLQLETSGVQVRQPELKLSLGRLSSQTTIQMREAWALDMQSRLTVQDMKLKAKQSWITLDQSEINLKSKKLKLLAMQPISANGNISLHSSLSRLAAQQVGRQVLFDQLGLSLSATFCQQALADIACEIPIRGLVLSDIKNKSRIQLPEAVLRLGTPRWDPQFTKPATARLDLRLASVKANYGSNRISLRRMRPVVEATIRSPHSLDLRTRVPIALMTVSMPGMSTQLFDTNLSLDLLELGVNSNDLAASRAQINTGLQITKTVINSPTGRLTGNRLALTARGDYQPGAPLEVSIQAPISRLRLSDPSRRKQIFVLSLPRTKVDLLVHQEQQKAQVSGLARIADLTVGNKTWPTAMDWKWTLKADLKKPSLHALVEMKENPKVLLMLKSTFEKSKKRLQYELDLQAQDLENVGQLLLKRPASTVQADLAPLKIVVDAKGYLEGVIRRFDKNAVPVLVPGNWTQLLATHQGRQQARLEVNGIDIKSNDIALQLPQLSLDLDARQEDGSTRAKLDLGLSQLHLATPVTSASMRGFQNSLYLEATDRLDKGSLRFRFDSKLEHLAQSVLPKYLVDNARIALLGSVESLSSLKVDSLQIENPAADTAFALSLTLEDPTLVSRAEPLSKASSKRLDQNDSSKQLNLLFGRQALTASGRFSQNLDRLFTSCDKACFSGKLVVPFQIESGDLSAFLVAASALLEDVSVSLPEVPLKINGFSGHIPFAVNGSRDADGQIRLLAGQLEQLYTRARFADVHPFIHKAHFLAVQNISLLGQEIGPIAGNLRLERDTLFLDQLQIAYRGGKITGQLIVRMQRGQPRLFFRGNLTGIRPSQTDQVLDANATLSLSLHDLALNGRIQIVRIGRAHLMDLLKLVDPYGEDTDINRVRLALNVGYPKFVRLILQDGFINIKVKLGGVAKLISIQEIRGIPLERLINRYLVPLLPQGVFGDDSSNNDDGLHLSGVVDLGNNRLHQSTQYRD